MTLRNFPPNFESDGSSLQQYESLRSQALNRQGIFSERGLTLFIRRGMLAWVEVCHRCIPVYSKPEKQVELPVFESAIAPEMIKIMANITLFNLEEALS